MQGPALLTTIVANMPDLTKPHCYFITHILLLFLSAPHRTISCNWLATAIRRLFTQSDFDYFSLSHQDSELRIYSAVINCPFLKRDIKLAYTQYLDELGLLTPETFGHCRCR